ncbi:MAG: phospho-sugar mutase [Fimbriimonadaceae bacterium]|nr:phospho-sugar mutase [Fimbriimonadaceae bacterium]
MADNTAAVAAVEAAGAAGRLRPAAVDNLILWLTGSAFEAWRAEVTAAVTAADWDELDDAFGQVIPFGTAGRRGREGLGPNRLNARTIAESAAGLADWVRAAHPGTAPTCVVAYDSRRHSAAYGRLCAEVLAARGVQVALFDGPRATPMLAYTVLAQGAQCGVMITASHNPPADNGIKAYGASGGQVVPPDDQHIIDCVNAVSHDEIEREDLDAALAEGRAVLLGQEADAAYWRYVAGQAISNERDCRLVYSPLQGVGGRCVLPVLERAGFRDVQVVAAQAAPSSEFENVANQVANPEVPTAMGEVLALCRATDADAGIASDPDADRIGFVARDPDVEGGYRFFNGNQIGVLVTWFACDAMAREGSLPADPVVLKTAVTTELIPKIAKHYGVACRGALPVGFRWFGEVLQHQLRAEQLIAAIEESHGINRGGLVRDKDAASAALALAELTAHLKAAGRTVTALLDDLYRQFGYHGEVLHNVVQPKRAAIDAILAALRANPPALLGGLAVQETEDRLAGDYLNPVTGQPVIENFLIYRLGGDDLLDEVKVAIRPSGTEPKMKVYVQGVAPVPPGGDLAAIRRATDELLASLPAALLAVAGV